MSPEVPHDDYDSLADRRSDQGVWNGTMGQAAEDGYYTDKPTERSKAKTSKPLNHQQRPTGRPRTEVGGSDLSRIEANNDALKNPMSPAEREEVRRGLGHSSALLMKEQLAYDLMMQRTEGDPQARAVALRKLADGKK